MPKSIVVLQGHPDAGARHLDHALAEAYAEGARAAGHRVEMIEIARLDFPLLRSQADFEHGTLPASLAPAAAAISAADHMVVVFPLWLGTMPALLKAFLEQVARPGIAFRYRAEGLPEQLWKGKSARIVVTMGMPALVYRVLYLAHGVGVLKRSILQFVGFAPVRTTLFGNIGEADKSAWLAEMRDLGARAE